ncbi:MAG TPA: cell division protein ZapA [Sumerlaeia bacterium]|nr:cell division protein ZapA [Sumerlaeia bacterium]
MSAESDLLPLEIYGQKFHLRAAAGDAERVHRVARIVDECIRAHRAQGANSDLRAALMAAYAFAYDLDEVCEGAGHSVVTTSRSMGSTHEAIDRLLAKLDREMGGHVSRQEQKRDGGEPKKTEPESA